MLVGAGPPARPLSAVTVFGGTAAMATATTTLPAPAPAPRAGTLASTRPRLADRGFRYLALGCGLLVLLILGLIAYSMFVKAWPAFRAEGLTFFTSKTWDPTTNRF